jgi:hypothetical protein
MQLRELDDAGVFDDMFAQIGADYARRWAAADDEQERENLWHRQRALRDVRREFNKLAGIDTNAT